MKCVFYTKALLMLYTEDFTMCHHVGFSQIGSHITRQNITVDTAKSIICIYVN